MDSFILVRSDILCVHCHRFCTVEQRRWQSWFASLRYCVFCGTKLQFTAADLVAEGYEEAKA